MGIIGRGWFGGADETFSLLRRRLTHRPWEPLAERHVGVTFLTFTHWETAPASAALQRIGGRGVVAGECFALAGWLERARFGRM